MGSSAWEERKAMPRSNRGDGDRERWGALGGDGETDLGGLREIWEADG